MLIAIVNNFIHLFLDHLPPPVVNLVSLRVFFIHWTGGGRWNYNKKCILLYFIINSQPSIVPATQHSRWSYCYAPMTTNIITIYLYYIFLLIFYIDEHKKLIKIFIFFIWNNDKKTSKRTTIEKRIWKI